MKNRFIPELHDVGKLLWKMDTDPNQPKDKLEDGTPVGRGHSFEGVDFSKFREPTTLSWLGIRYHMSFKGNIKLSDSNFLPNLSFEDKKALFLLIIADHLASSSARVLRETSVRNDSKTIYSLWKKRLTQEPKLISNKQDLKRLFDFLGSDPDFEKYREEYEIGLVPEDAKEPKNVTSLLTHSQLVGQIYRVLNSCIEISNSTLIYDGIVAETIDEAEKGWKFRFIQGRIKFHQYLGRVVDLNIFKVMEDILERFKDTNPDNLIFYTLDSFELFVPCENFFNLRESLKPFLDNGFYLELKVFTSTLSRLRGSNISKLLNESKEPELTYKVLYPADKIDISVSPPLCEICQMYQGTEDWPPIEPVERICPSCRKIREAVPENRWREFAKWEEEDVDVAWVKVSLDRKRLDKTLPAFFREYCIQTSVRDVDRAVEDFRPLAVTRDFVEEYKNFLERFNKRLLKAFPNTDDNYQCETISAKAKDLYAVKLTSLSQVIEILKVFNEEHKDYFPACIEESPVKIGISISKPKYPYFKHYQILSDDKNPSVYINLVGKGEVRTETSHLDEILVRAEGFDQRGKTALHRLAEISKLSETLATATLVDKEDKDRETYYKLSELLPMGLKHSDILTLSKILGD